MADVPDRLSVALQDRYTVERELGRGGMATVYLAEDLRHRRKVALKVLKPELAAVLGAERFVQEITTTAALQHPHILPLFDSGSADSFLFYVMPFIDGETLRAKLDRETQLGVDEAVRIARDVADALEYAHRHGVIHRDIKPENILLHDGRPIVADFGIALAMSAAAGGRMTETGLSLGTPHYMSPEQATGAKEISARSDVYSLGTVLYEMLAGEPPHTGGSAQQIIMKIIAEPAQGVTELRKSVPPNVAGAVAQALEKLPADRFESARAFAEALGNPGYRSPSAGGPAAAGLGGARPLTRPLVATSVLAVAAMAAALWGWFGRPPLERPRPPVRFFVAGDSARAVGETVAIAPDGRTIVFSGWTTGGLSLFVQRLDEFEAKPIPGTSDATGEALFFSPDGSAVAFSAGPNLKRVRLDGQDLIVVAPIELGFSGAWGPDGTIVFSSLLGTLKRVSARGGPVTEVTMPRRGTRPAFIHPTRFLPGGRSILCVEGFPSRSLGVLDLGSGEYRPIGRGESPSYSRGHLLYVTADGTLMAQRFDPARLDTLSAAERVMDGFAPDIRWAWGSYDVSDSGSLVFRPAGSGNRSLDLVEAGGARRSLMRARGFWVPRISPDGRSIAFGGYENTANTNADVWIYDLTTGADRRLTTGGQTGRNFNDPVWSRDGRRIAFDGRDTAASRVLGGQGKAIYTVSADGTGGSGLIPAPAGDNWPTDWTPDDRYIVFTHNGPNTPASIWMVPSDGKGDARPVVESAFEAIGGRVSPDGHWLAYQSKETGQDEVYVRPFPAAGLPVRVSTGGGTAPSWTRGGRELVYRSTGKTDQLVAVEVRLGGTVELGARRVLLPDANLIPSPLAPYDVTSDGRRMVLITAPPRPNRFGVVLDLFPNPAR